MKRMIGMLVLLGGIGTAVVGVFMPVLKLHDLSEIASAIWLPVLASATLLGIGAHLLANKPAYCADCGQYLGKQTSMTSPCPKCGCNIYTTTYTGVGRTTRVR